MSTVGRRQLLMLLIHLAGRGPTEGLGGITRLQKLLFLLEHEEDLTPTGEGYEFTPYKAGPYSAKLYDDLELLENLGLLESEPTAIATEAEAAEIEAGEESLSFDKLIGSDDEDGLAPDAFEERRFRLTPQGLDKIEALISAPSNKVLVDKVKRIRARYGAYSLSDLLYYVYTKYPEMTVESEIRDQVLGRGRPKR